MRNSDSGALPRATKGTRWLLVAIQVVVALLVLELCARTDDWLTWRAPFWTYYGNELLFVNDPLGYHLRPGARFEKWRINQQGFRSPDTTESKPRSVFRIVTLGASETFGLYEDDGFEYPAQLQKLLEKDHPGEFEVLNAAIPGASPNQTARHWRTRLRQFSPDLVIYYPTASFILEPEERLATPKGNQQSKLPMVDLRMAGKLRTTYKRWTPVSMQTAIRRFLIMRELSRHSPEWLLTSVPIARVEAFRITIESLVDAVRADGAAMILATHANQVTGLTADADRTLLLAWRSQMPNRTEFCILETERRANEVVKDVAGRNGVPVAGVDAAIPKTSQYFSDYQHFTNKGAEFVAKLLVPLVLETASARNGRNRVNVTQSRTPVSR